MILENKYKIISLLGEGAFCSVFLGININTEEEVAIKIEDKNSNTCTLQHEAKIYLYLNKTPGIPKVKIYGSNNKYNFLILDRLGISLYDLTLKLCRIPVKDLLIIAKEILIILKNIHSKGIIHRDLKPENFLFEKYSSNINIIDFGLARQYIKNGKHIIFKDKKKLLGTSIFASLNNHKGEELSRRDDLESFLYSIIYCGKGYLPWENIDNKKNINNEEYNQNIFNIKNSISVDELINGLEDWKNLKELILYVRNLKFYEDPDYNKINMLLN